MHEEGNTVGHFSEMECAFDKHICTFSFEKQLSQRNQINFKHFAKEPMKSIQNDLEKNQERC